MKTDIVRRYSHNPILTKAEIPYPVETVHNAAVVKHGNEYIMLFRSHLRTGRSIIGLARSHDGFRFAADPQPFLTPERDGSFAAYEEFGVEDPRVTLVDGEYVITYSAYSRNGVRIALAKTKDFRQVERKGIEQYGSVPHDQAKCEWFDAANKRQEGVFELPTLEPAGQEHRATFAVTR